MWGAGFRHCWILKPTYFPERALTATVTTLKLEPTALYLDWQHWGGPPEAHVQELLTHEETKAIIAVRIETPPRHSSAVPGLRGMMTCVSVVKYALGIRAPLVWTPKALCDYLVRHRNGQPVQREI